MEKIKIGIYGYGNLGKGVEIAVKNNPDMELVGIFTRREPSSLKTIYSDSPVYNVVDAPKMKDKIDVMILCGGSATDLPVQGPEVCSMFNTVDSFDTHAKVPEYFTSMNETATKSNTLALISYRSPTLPATRMNTAPICSTATRRESSPPPIRSISPTPYASRPSATTGLSTRPVA